MAVPKSYLVCATHRSGSNLLCQALWLTKLAGYPQEAFSPTRAPRIAEECAISSALEDDAAGYVNALLDRRSTENGVFGAKIMWAHVEPLVEKLGGGAIATTLGQHFPNLRYIWMRRRDKIWQAISLWKAKQTNIYNSMQLGERDPKTEEPQYDYAEIKKGVERFEREDAQWEAFFAENRIEPFEVHYEHLVEHYEETALGILHYLGVSLPDSFQVPPTNYQKLGDVTNEEWYARYLAEES